MKTIRLIVTLILFSAQLSSGKDKNKFDFSGYLASQLEIESFKNGEVEHEAKFELETKRKNGFKAEFDIRFESDDNEATIREAIINRKFGDEWRLDFGYGKKHFGIEYEDNKLERETISRSPIYRRLEVFTFAGRETQVRWYKKGEGDLYSLSLGHSESQNTSLVASWQTSLNEDWKAIQWVQTQSHHGDDEQRLVWVGMSSFLYEYGIHSFENEWVFGMDPDQSELDRTIGIGQYTRFAGAKVQYGYSIQLEEDEYWKFVLQSTAIYHDLEVLGYNSIQMLIGASYNLEPFHIGVNLEGLGSTSRLDPSNRNYSESSGRIEIVYEL